MTERVRQFHISDILSITHDRLFSTRHMDGIYDLCNFLTQHQLPRVHAECKAHLLAMHPRLKALPMLSDDDIGAMKAIGRKDWCAMWLNAQIDRFGKYLEVTPIPKGIHEYKDPIAEAVEMVGSKNVIVIDAKEPQA